MPTTKTAPASKAKPKRKTKAKAVPDKKKEPEKDIAASYNKFKDYKGQFYTGMKVGRSHKWYYEEGEWKEKKISPDNWEFSFNVIKRRAGKAPKGSGVPVGTEYHWYILADQRATKLDANSYDTEMSGLKFKIAHKRADKTKWSASEKAQKKKLIRILEQMVEGLKEELEEASEKKAS